MCLWGEDDGPPSPDAMLMKTDELGTQTCWLFKVTECWESKKSQTSKVKWNIHPNASAWMTKCLGLFYVNNTDSCIQNIAPWWLYHEASCLLTGQVTRVLSSPVIFFLSRQVKLSLVQIKKKKHGANVKLTVHRHVRYRSVMLSRCQLAETEEACSAAPCYSYCSC